VSDRTHKRQLDRARAKREHDRFEARRRRSRIVIVVMVALLVLSLVGVSLITLAAGDDGAPAVSDEPDDAAGDDGDATVDEDGASAADVEPCPSAEDPPEAEGEVYDDPPRTDLEDGARYLATIATTCGDIELELAADDAPRTVENFVALAEDDYYVGTPFHRLMWDFVIQGGDPAGTGCGQDDCMAFDPEAPTFPGYELEDELDGLSALEEGAPGTVTYPRGTVAMANAGPDTQGSQFFVVQADPGYDFPPAYTVLGEVTEGMDVVDRIAAGPVQGDQATDPVYVTEVTIGTR
jgi:cyclophilin family peptidyl-prolyl cis-trans isomerase